MTHGRKIIYKFINTAIVPSILLPLDSCYYFCFIICATRRHLVLSCFRYLKCTEAERKRVISCKGDPVHMTKSFIITLCLETQYNSTVWVFIFDSVIIIWSIVVTYTKCYRINARVTLLVVLVTWRSQLPGLEPVYSTTWRVWPLLHEDHYNYMKIMSVYLY
jgi:hypothetical protein